MPISLPTASISTSTVGGSTIDTRDTVAVSAVTIDYISNTVYVVFVLGTPANNLFTVSLHPNGVPAALSINISNGSWSSNGIVGGTLTSQQLSVINTGLKNLRNGLESFASNSGVVSGTVVPWS